MQALRIEILNPKALKLIQDLHDLKLIKITDEPQSKAKAFLEKMRKKADKAPSLEEITVIVEEVRTERNAKK